jgi:hypothetical protein
MRPLWVVILAYGLAMVLMPLLATAQEASRPPLAWDIARDVLVDPTTYAPAAVSYVAQRWDWETSQVFLERGWMEKNAHFTISGRPNDLPLSYEAGMGQIRGEALVRLGWSVTNNLAAGVCERVLISRYPEHKKLIRTMSWIERVSVASYMLYVGSIEHFRQVSRNHRLARVYGYSP